MTRHDRTPVVREARQPPLDEGFQPAALYNRAFQSAANDGAERTVRVALERPGTGGSIHQTLVIDDEDAGTEHNLVYLDRLLKTLLWQRGAATVYIDGPKHLAERIAHRYGPLGARAFDASMMTRIYQEEFRVIHSANDFPTAITEPTVKLGGNLGGRRIGFDLGASDYKVSAVADGDVIFTAEYPWDPRTQSDPQYHYHHITQALEQAAAHLDGVDAIGGSSAGVWIGNQARVASLFRGLSEPDFERSRNLFDRIARDWGVPLTVINDGEVTALAASMSAGINSVLGIAMGSSEAAGYVGADRKLTPWLNELAFVPIDFNQAAPEDEWSGDIGCGAQYLSQVGVARLAERAGIAHPADMQLPERLVDVQELHLSGDPRTPAIYETIGTWLGYALALYAEHVPFDHVLVLGRVTTGPGGDTIRETAIEVLDEEFPELQIDISLPDGNMRRVGQAVAAASLPRTPHGGPDD